MFFNNNRRNSSNTNNPPHSSNEQQRSAPGGIRDYGAEPLVANIRNATLSNNRFRTTFWTGRHLQITLMSLRPREDVGLEMHPRLDQMLVVQQGFGRVLMGTRRDRMTFNTNIMPNYVIVIPAGAWHNIINIGNTPLKMYSVYAPPEHRRDTIHNTRSDADHDHEYSARATAAEVSDSNISEETQTVVSDELSSENNITDAEFTANNISDEPQES